jgi:hypothetical protein
MLEKELIEGIVDRQLAKTHSVPSNFGVSLLRVCFGGEGGPPINVINKEME